MNQELHAYLQGMQQYILTLEKRLRSIEKTVQILSNELNEQKSRSPIHVGTIEYKFDQLKVETLEGTLNIGLNHDELEKGIEELQVDGPKQGNPFSPKQMLKRTIDIEDRIHHYLEKDLEPLVKKYGEELNIDVNESHLDFIKKDIKQQLSHRIDYYYKQIPASERSPEASEKITGQIEKQLIKDIEHAVLVFLKNLPTVRKDDDS